MQKNVTTEDLAFIYFFQIEPKLPQIINLFSNLFSLNLAIVKENKLFVSICTELNILIFLCMYVCLHFD